MVDAIVHPILIWSVYEYARDLSRIVTARMERHG